MITVSALCSNDINAQEKRETHTRYPRVAHGGRTYHLEMEENSDEKMPELIKSYLSKQNLFSINHSLTKILQSRTNNVSVSICPPSYIYIAIPVSINQSN